MTTELSEFDAKAAESGSLATERFRDSGKTAALEVPKERVSLLANEVLGAVYGTIRKHKVTYDEFNALKSWLISVGEDGEWPLFLDVWVEHVVEEVSTEDREGNKAPSRAPTTCRVRPGWKPRPRCPCGRTRAAPRCCSRARSAPLTVRHWPVPVWKSGTRMTTF
ncbi:catechol 1,2-dioxygenas, partial [Arthrobacter sp. Hiyo6]